MPQTKLRIITPNPRAVVFVGPADITAETTDAIVNAANSYLVGGGGVDGAIHRAGGRSILDECKRYVSQKGPLEPGQAMLTSGGNLSAKYVIHTVGPVYRGGHNREQQLLASCYRESIRLADENNIRSLAFPAISTGAFGYPFHEAATVAVNSVLDALEKSEKVELVRFVLFDISAVDTHIKAAERVLKDHTGHRLDRDRDSEYE